MSDESRAIWLRKTMAAFGLLLFAITWRLWTPQTEFPQIPFFRWLVNVPGAVDWIVASAMTVGLVAMLLGTQRWARGSLVLFLASTAVLVLLNQHRLQPWVYLLLVTGGLLVCLPNKTSLTWLRRIVISIYLYSAISKFDYQFVFTVGDQMLNVITSSVGFKTDGLPQWLHIAMVLSLPLGELVIGGLLLFSQTSKLGGWLAIGLHIGLLLVLGPLGLNHQPGVLIWNAWFIVQSWLLFMSAAPDAKPKEPRVDQPMNFRTEQASVDSRSPELIWCGRLLALFVILFPVTCAVSPWIELPIKADHWVAWEVYAPRSSRASVRVSDTAWAGTTTDAAGYDPDDTQSNDSAIPKAVTPNQWSLSRLGVPVYPQDRFQAACWLAFLESDERTNGRPPAVNALGTAARLTGQRVQTRIDGPVATQKYRGQLWFNTRPRWK